MLARWRHIEEEGKGLPVLGVGDSMNKKNTDLGKPSD